MYIKIQDFNIFCCIIIYYDTWIRVKISIKPWYGLVRVSLNFVRALWNLMKLVSTRKCSSSRVRSLAELAQARASNSKAVSSGMDFLKPYNWQKKNRQKRFRSFQAISIIWKAMGKRHFFNISVDANNRLWLTDQRQVTPTKTRTKIVYALARVNGNTTVPTELWNDWKFLDECSVSGYCSEKKTSIWCFLTKNQIWAMSRIRISLIAESSFGKKKAFDLNDPWTMLNFWICPTNITRLSCQYFLFLN